MQARVDGLGIKIAQCSQFPDGSNHLLAAVFSTGYGSECSAYHIVVCSRVSGEVNFSELGHFIFINIKMDIKGIFRHFGDRRYGLEKEVPDILVQTHDIGVILVDFPVHIILFLVKHISFLKTERFGQGFIGVYGVTIPGHIPNLILRPFVHLYHYLYPGFIAVVGIGIHGVFDNSGINMAVVAVIIQYIFFSFLEIGFLKHFLSENFPPGIFFQGLHFFGEGTVGKFLVAFKIDILHL